MGLIQTSLQESLAKNGFAVIEGFCSEEEMTRLTAALASEMARGRAGTRQLHQRVPAVLDLLRRGTAADWIEEAIPGGFVVRSILFDKTAEANWGVPWHQDLSICVKEKHDLPGFSAWSMKDGVPHVQPPVEILERMVTIRLHLDDCAEDNGALLVIPGSHRQGRLSADQIAAWRNTTSSETCPVPRGGAVVMRPLLLHASSPAVNPRHRRVLHVEFAAEPLPAPLEWIC